MFSAKNNKKIKGFTPSAMDCLIKHPWPGNVRELMNAIERGVVLSRSEYIEDTDLPMVSENRSDRKEASPAAAPSDTSEDCFPLEKVEKKAILKTLQIADGNKSKAAKILGITRKTLHKKLKKYGLMP